MKKLLILCVFLLQYFVVYSQVDFKPGKIIANSGDTIYGEIDYQSEIQLSKLCRFRKDKNETPSEFKPGDIHGFRFVDGKFFVSKTVNGETFFLEYLIDGKLDLFSMATMENEIFYLESVDKPLKEIPYTESIKNINGANYLYKSTLHFGLLNYYTNDLEGFSERIKKISNPTIENLIPLIQEYNEKACPSGYCILYAKKVPKVKASYELNVGTIFFSKELAAISENPFAANFIAHVWLPHLNEKLFIKTGVSYLHYGQPDLASFFAIPIQLEYQYPRGTIRPNIALGTYIFTPLLLGSVGLKVKLTKNFWLSTNCDVIFGLDRSISGGFKYNYTNSNLSLGVCYSY